jgi:hypothetical protein
MIEGFQGRNSAFHNHLFVGSLRCQNKSLKSGGAFLLSMTFKLSLFLYSGPRTKDVTGGTVQPDDGHKWPESASLLQGNGFCIPSE